MSLVRRFPTDKQFIDGAEDFEAMVTMVRTQMDKDSQQQQGQQPTAKTFERFFTDGARDSCVVVRVRPILHFDHFKYSIIKMGVNNTGCCSVLAPSVSLKGARSVEVYPYDVDATFSEADDTAALYNTVCRPLVQLAIDGASASIVAYGQTGSGKTFTTQGIMHLVAEDLIARGVVRAAKDSTTTTEEPPPHRDLLLPSVSITAIEIMGDAVRDLIGEKDVAIIDDPAMGMVIRGVSEITVTTSAEMLEHIHHASERRRTRITPRNESGSSRSHMAILIRFRRGGGDASSSSGGVCGGLTIVDLAGSENAHDSATHDRAAIKETKQINTSLMTLKDCIRTRNDALTTSTRHVHIPFRQSKLTLLLRDAFDLSAPRPAKFIIITCVSPVCTDVKHTCNTLKYAALLKVTPPPPKFLPASDNPLFWDRQAVIKYLCESGAPSVAVAEAITPDGCTGRALACVPATHFVQRAVGTGAMTVAAAEELYLTFWSKLVDARTVKKGSAMPQQPADQLGEEDKFDVGPVAAVDITSDDVTILLGEVEKDEAMHRRDVVAAETEEMDCNILMHMDDVAPQAASLAALRVTVRIGPAAMAAMKAAFRRGGSDQA